MYYIIRSLDENVENFIVFDHSKFIHLIKTAWENRENRNRFNEIIELALQRSSVSYKISEKYSKEFISLFRPHKILDSTQRISFNEHLVSAGSAVSLDTDIIPKRLVNADLPPNRVIVNGRGVKDYKYDMICSTDEKKVLGLSFNGRYKILIKIKDDDERCL